MIKLRNYNQNTARNANYVQIGTLRLYFSYDTIVAFEEGCSTKVVQNQRGPTTEKHLNWIDGGRKEDRLDRDVFNAELQKVLLAHNLAQGQQ